ncbi:NTP transferase domain-containing protein [Rhizobium laguerreae]|uniref:NTP transferase domain-containing protein n=1 Tax=Rhizobium laguerreae TaxID=1076926 RepID=UPI001C911590|nr:molybdopterin-binding/glycosyltransferase family 2 protein [Rhizobium laguerreae]MBY3418345.1 NTP transferase domain-containing protein [Rhizobium laguerreae]
MKFGEVATSQAIGCILAHSTKVAARALPKGQVLGVGEIEELLNAGIRSLTVASLDDGDVPENYAADALAAAIGSSQVRISPATTGRVNFYAEENGIFWPDKEAVDLFNSVDPAITLATLAEGGSVKRGEMVATIKIIPLAVSNRAIGTAVSSLFGRAVLTVDPYLRHDVVLISTQLPTLKQSVIDKTTRNLVRRLESSHSTLVSEFRSDHRADAVAEQIRDALRVSRSRPQVIVIFGASAVTDERDVIPEAIRLAGGRVLRVGMPVDPGNLLVIGDLAGVPVIGAPGCARSSKENGFDWILRRLLTGERPEAIDITRMGVGGLLKEIPTRPSPRQGRDQRSKPISVAAVLLAAGTSSRMGDGIKHKLLARFDGIPLVRRTASSVLNSRVTTVVAVTGHRNVEIENALEGLCVRLCHNSSYLSGIASSLACGISEAAKDNADGVLVALADMPNVSPSDINALIDAFIDAEGLSVVRAATHGKRGNPVIIPRSLFADVLALQGDVGAKHVIQNSGLNIVDVQIGKAAHIDVDTPEALMAAGGAFEDSTH